MKSIEEIAWKHVGKILDQTALYEAVKAAIHEALEERERKAFEAGFYAAGCATDGEHLADALAAYKAEALGRQD